MKTIKTNAMRLLDKAGIPYQTHQYQTGDGAIDGLSVAQKTGQSPHIVYKTLVAKGASGCILIFCLPVNSELNLKAAARAANEKNVALLPLAQVTTVTGYVRGGVSPLAMKKQYPTFIDEQAKAHSSIVVSGGRVGFQIEIEPNQLCAVAEGAFFSNHHLSENS